MLHMSWRAEEAESSAPIPGAQVGILGLRVKARVHRLFELEPGHKGIGHTVSLALAGLIALNVAAVMLETVEDIYARFTLAFHLFEVVSVTIFGAEYLLRVWSCTTEPRYRHPVVGRLRYMVSPMALVDLVAVVPSLIPGSTLDLRFMRSIRLLRLLRSLKLARYSHSLQTLGRVLRSRKELLGITAFSGFVLMICAASSMYFAEHEVQPKLFSSIPASMWWGVETLTTVGYGDVYPVTPLGKTIAAIVAVLGIGIFALPAGIIAGGFSEELHKERGGLRMCPHCHKEIG
jgi:voltage-gated potassium channel